MGGKPLKFRTVFDVTKDAFSLTQEFSTGGAWERSAEAKGRRIAP